MRFTESMTSEKNRNSETKGRFIYNKGRFLYNKSRFLYNKGRFIYNKKKDESASHLEQKPLER